MIRHFESVAHNRAFLAHRTPQYLWISAGVNGFATCEEARRTFSRNSGHARYEHMIINPNDPFGHKEEWRRLGDEWERRSAMLETLDEALRRYAKRYQMRVRESGKGHVRYLEWTNSFSVECSIAISLALEGTLLLRVGASGTQDRKVDARWARYSKHETISSNVAIDVLQETLEEHLDRGRVLVEPWTGADLEFGTWLPWPV